jgi:hypothetical protein
MVVLPRKLLLLALVFKFCLTDSVASEEGK